MLIRKIQYKISKVSQSLYRRTHGIEINWGYVIFSFFCIASILLLGANIFRIIRKGYERYEIIQSEKRRLEELMARNARLHEDLKYYSSKEFVDVKAREELNLAFPNQKLVYIEKEMLVELDEGEAEKEELSPCWMLWYELIF